MHLPFSIKISIFFDPTDPIMPCPAARCWPRQQAARRGALLGLLLLLGYLGSGCDRSGSTVPPQEPDLPVWFADRTQESGLNFVHDAGPVGSYFLPQIMGSGAALFDFDGDGRLDIYLVQNGGPNSRSTNRLFR